MAALGNAAEKNLEGGETSLRQTQSGSRSTWTPGREIFSWQVAGEAGFGVPVAIGAGRPQRGNRRRLAWD
jgi:hypothetical protein